MVSEHESLWDYEEAAAYLKIAESTCKRWAKERKIPVVKVGGLIRFRPLDLRQWVEERAEEVRADA